MSCKCSSFFPDSDVSHQLDGEVTSDNVSHLTTAKLNCISATYDLIGLPQITCLDGTWEPAGLRSCDRKLFIRALCWSVFCSYYWADCGDYSCNTRILAVCKILTLHISSV